jgi:hypothetical protein
MSQTEEKFAIYVNRAQLTLLRKILDNYARLGMGQLDVSLAERLRHLFPKRMNREVVSNYHEHRGDPTWTPVVKPVRDLVEEKIAEIKLLVWGHSPGQSYGIRAEEVPAECREAYDMRQVVGKVLVDLRPGNDYSVDDRPYWATNPDLPPIEVKALGSQGPLGGPSFMLIAARLAGYSFQETLNFSDITPSEQEIFGNEENFNAFLESSRLLERASDVS